MDLDYLEALRTAELRQVIGLLPPGASILELGAGAGWQARMLAEHGFAVEAIDVAASNYAEHQVFPVRTYDGHRIPFEDGRFDVVFSSNVLEHIPHVDALQSELQRVLRPGGLAVHLVPSGGWRFWSNLTHYVHLAGSVRRQWSRDAHLSLPKRIYSALLHRPGPLRPPRHGERGSALTETFWFSQWFWTAFFRRHGWKVMRRSSNHLFYTGYVVFGSRLGLRLRRSLSRVAGSACWIYVLEKPSGLRACPSPAHREVA